MRHLQVICPRRVAIGEVGQRRQRWLCRRAGACCGNCLTYLIDDRRGELSLRLQKAVFLALEELIEMRSGNSCPSRQLADSRVCG